MGLLDLGFTALRFPLDLPGFPPDTREPMDRRPHRIETKFPTSRWGLTLLALVATLWNFGMSAAAADVDPLDVLEARCVACHNDDRLEGEISFETRSSFGRFMEDEQATETILEVVRPGANGDAPEMPKKGDPLSAEEVAALARWFDDGASWPEGRRLEVSEDDGSEWWAFQPLRVSEPTLPESTPEAWRTSPIDRYVFAKLSEEGLSPSEPASRRDWIRRATYDLTGAPPTPKEVEAFLADESDRAYARVVDRLLASPRYGERWGRHWMDVIRFGESRGFERNEIIRNLWPYRDYLIRSFNEDKPFDQLIRESLAGDVLDPGNPDVEIGAAFLVAGPYDDVGNQDPKQAAQIRANTIDEVIRATSEAFLGLTIGCARCHSHKFDPITQRDYYSWYATFAGVRHGSRVVASEEEKARNAALREPLEARRRALESDRAAIEKAIAERGETLADTLLAGATREPVSRRGTEERFEPTPARFLRLVVEGTERNPAAGSSYTLEEIEVWSAGETPKNVALLENGGTALGASRQAEDFDGAYSPELTIDGRLGARWLASGPILTLEFAKEETIDRVVFSSDRNGDAGDHGVAAFLVEYRIEVSKDGESWTEVADSHDRRPANAAHRAHRLREAVITPSDRERLAALNQEIQAINAEIGEIPDLPNWWVGNPTQVDGPFHVFLGGSPEREGPEVVPASLSTLSHVAEDYSLAPSSPESKRRLELADWLVSGDNPLTPRVLANRVWHYHFGRGIVATPSDFGEMGELPTHPKALDWLATKLVDSGWRLKALHREIMLSQTYRQSAAYRENAARVDGASRFLWRFPPRRLEAEAIRDTFLYISGVMDESMGGPGFKLYKYMQDNVATYEPLDSFGPETYRRSVYHHNARSSSVDLLTDFDCPDSAIGTPRRVSTTTPLQALTLMNHSFSADMASALASRVRREVGAQPDAQVARIYELAYSRDPRPGELRESLEFISHQGLEAYARVILNSNELIYLN